MKFPDKCKIDFASIQWEIPAEGVRFKPCEQNCKQVTKVMKMIFVKDIP